MKPFGLSAEIELKIAFKLQLQLIIPPTPLPTVALGESTGWTTGHWRGFRDHIFVLLAKPSSLGLWLWA